MKTKRVCAVMIICAVVMACAFPAYAYDIENSYVTALYNESNGLPTGEANDVIQTSDGYIWIGSYGGLIRYDGSTFRDYSEMIDSAAVRALYEDSSGKLWIGTNNYGVYVMEDGVFTSINSPSDNSYLCIRDFAEGADGKIYIASNSGMGEINGADIVPYKGEYINGGTVYSVGVDSRGRVWGALNGGLCAVVKDGTAERVFSSDDFFSETDIYCLTSDTEGNIYLGTSGNSAAKLTFTSDSLDPAEIKTEYFTTDNVTTHNRICTDKNGRVIVCGNIGLYVIEADGSSLTFGEAEKATALNGACVDYEGNIWLASTSHGVIKYTLGCFGSPNSAAALEGVPINAVVSQNGRCYAATDNGLFIFDNSWNRVTNELTELYDGVRVRCFTADSRGRIWVAANSAEAAVACYDPSNNSIQTFSESEGLVNTQARTITELSDGSIAVGTQGGVSIISGGKVVRSYGSERFTVTTVLCLLETDLGTLLVGSDGGGIYEIDGDNVTNHSFDEGLSDGAVLRIIADSNGGGYFVSAGSSLYYWNDGGFKTLSNIKKDAGSIFDMYDRDGMLWILQNNGILSFDKEKLLKGEVLSPKGYYTVQHGLSGSLNANTWNRIDNDGNLYISTRSGISVFGFSGVSNILPLGIIGEVSVDGVQYNHPKTLSVDRGASRVTIDFAALSYTDTTQIGIAYCLEGFDKEETILIGEKSGSISYTNLPGGEYTFRLRIFDPENPDNQNICELSLEKEKKLYEYPAFIIAIVLVGAAVVAGVVLLVSRAKIASIQKRQKEYRSIIEQALQTFARTIDAKDTYTNGHSLRVARYSRELAKRMGKSETEQENIYYIALLHDIGKIGIPDSILNKPDKLTEEERGIIQTHPTIGGDILKKFTALDGIADGAKYHHERFDGNGYCEGLKGEDIPPVARIIGVADTYDTMSSDRCYRKAMSSEVIIKELTEGSGSQLDPEVVRHMLDMIKEGAVPIKLESDDIEDFEKQ
ncbi:MAG: HD domain-containing protein [Oscillospiraceae bacterium]|nr:HD domain-containing protein [Oscillospiraceae bacterium]